MGIKAIKLDTGVGDVRDCTQPHPHADYVLPSGACPACKATPWKIQGGEVTRGHDTYTAPARCVACGERVGALQVQVSTLFGLEEDERVLYGRCRVY